MIFKIVRSSVHISIIDVAFDIDTDCAPLLNFTLIHLRSFHFELRLRAPSSRQEKRVSKSFLAGAFRVE